MLDVSAAYTAAIKDKNRTDRIAGTIKLCDGETITITDDLILNNSVTLKEQLVSGDTFEIGTFYTNQLDITVYDDDFLSRSYANARITPKYEILLAGGTWESVPLGIFTVDNSLTKRKGSIHKLTAFDDSTRFDVNISAYAGGRKTVQQHIKDAAADVGIELATTDFGAYPNDNLTVDSTISTEIQTYRDLIEWCCAIMAASARINRYGKLEIVKLKEKTTTVDDALIYDPDYTVEGYERTGTEFFDLRALTKYFSTTFDGEQYVYTNISTLDDSAARKATLYIPENPLLQSLSIETRKSAFQSCADAMTIALRRVEFSFNGNPAIECFDTLCGSGGKIDVNRTIAFFPTTLVWKYRGAHKVSCAFAELTDEATATVLEMTLASNEQSKTPVQVKSKTEKRLDGVGKKATSGGNDGVGKYTNSDKNCEIFNDYSGNKAESYYAHAEGSKTAATAPYSHAEGRETTASNESAHAEGMNTFATGRCAHAEGMGTVARGSNSHASGYYTVAGSEHMTAIGRYNSTTSNALLVIGNGYGEDRRSNALVVDDAGNLYISGALNAAGGTGIDLSEYLKSDEISDWAKAESKPVYTAEEVGAAEKNHTHNMSDITDMPEWTKTENKPAYTATEVGAATVSELDSKDYLKASDLTGQTVDLNTLMLNIADDKGKSKRYFCTSGSAQYITNRPVSANEPFELTVDNVRFISATGFNTVQRYTSVTRKRSYTRWCDDKTWRAWMCDTDLVIYGTVSSALSKSFEYATYGEGYNQVEIEPYYDSNTNPIRNRIVLTLTIATAYDRDVLSVDGSVEHLNIENGNITMSVTGAKTLSFMIKYTNKRA
ncbi:MAG: hypothetical protein KH377_00130 [[Eubacterium] siraeum]|nr:hypothetical protein [[Eubacterium] siraeum]